MLAARHRLPAVYPFRYFVTAGGLISYGANTIDMHRRAAAQRQARARPELRHDG
jgi:putative ABC transport system substrate-binding protein